jgi:hypothetical protein
MGGAEMKKVGNGERRLYGPRALLVCGFPPEEQDAMQGLAEGLTEGRLDEPLPVVFAADEDERVKVGTLLQRAAGSGQGRASGLHRAVIMSGLQEAELHLLMAVYRRLDLPRPLWATLTPTSETWTLGRLLDELAAEDGVTRG